MRITRILISLVLATLSVILFVRWLYTPPANTARRMPSDTAGYYKSRQKEIALVAASQRKDNTAWLSSPDAPFSSWEKNIYVTDDPSAPLTVPTNKGREGQVFLTYIIDNYQNLPSVVVFLHAERYQWHNDDPLYDGLRMLSRLQTSYIRQEGYVNLRCVHTLGCPVEIRPYSETRVEDADWKTTDAVSGRYYLDAFQQIFPDMEVPKEIGVSCCAQFAVAGWKIRERPREDYVRFREWLTKTSLRDDLSGRIMEYSWHVIFGRDPVHCPNAQECYCKTYGLCDLSCKSEGVCESQYTLPKFSHMPEGWPDYDWDKEWRNVTKLRAQQELDYAPEKPIDNN